jgi:hypothetical protein
MHEILKRIEESPAYCMSFETLEKTFSREDILKVADNVSITAFMFQGDLYIGTEQGRLDYHADKLAGTNPFYQTS